MTRRTLHHLRRSAAALGLAGLLLGALPAGARAATPESPQQSGRSAVATTADPPGTRYLYRGTFTATVTHDVFVDWEEGAYDERSVTATLQGTIPRLKADDLDLVSLRPGASTVQVITADAHGVTKTDRGQEVQVCDASSGKAIGPPLVMPRRRSNGLTAFAYLGLPADCTRSDGSSSTMTYGYGPLVADLHDVALGGPSVQIPFRAERGIAPLTGAEQCPGYIPDQTTTCSYVIDGLLTLELIKKIPPRRKPPKGASLTRNATKVTAGFACPQRCAVTATVRPLGGGAPVAAPKTVTAPADRTVRLQVAIPKARRAAVKRSGGVAIRLAYRFADGTKAVENRKARR